VDKRKPGPLKGPVASKETAATENAKAVKQATKAPPFEIHTPSTRKTFLKLMVYADYGVGKTFLMGTAASVPSMRDILMIDAEAGDLTLDDDADSGYDFGVIDRVRVKNYGQVARVQEFLKSHCRLATEGDTEKMREREAWLKGVKIEDIKKPRHYKTVIIDTLTEVEAFCMYQLLGVTDATRIDEEVQSPEWAEYKRQHQMVQRLVRGYRDLPMHLLVACSRAYTQDDQKRFNYNPMLTGKLASQVQGFMDMVGYYVLRPGGEDGSDAARRLYVQPVGRWNAKCRFTSYKKPYFDNPDMDDILKAVGLAGKASSK